MRYIFVLKNLQMAVFRSFKKSLKKNNRKKVTETESIQSDVCYSEQEGNFQSHPVFTFVAELTHVSISGTSQIL